MHTHQLAHPCENNTNQSHAASPCRNNTNDTCTPHKPSPLTNLHPTQVTESYMQCSTEERDALLYALLALHPGRTLVFTNAISTVRRVTSILRLLGVPASPLHASMQQRQRLKYLDRCSGGGCWRIWVAMVAVVVGCCGCGEALVVVRLWLW